MNSKKGNYQVVFISCLLMGLALLSGCGEKPKQWFTYEVQDALEVDLEKMEVYEDKVVLQFSADAFDSIESIRCFDAQFQEIAADATFELKKDALTVYTAEAKELSAIRIDVDANQYFEIRYLDSDAYSMMRYDYTDGALVESGDADSFDTKEEKALQDNDEELTAVYTYDMQDEFGLNIQKMEVYESKVMIQFAEGSVNSVESIMCNVTYSSAPEWDATFEFKDNQLIIYSAAAEYLTGVKIDVDDKLSYRIRYLDSDAYVVLRCEYVDGEYVESGYIERFYTKLELEEKAAAEEYARSFKERVFSILGGTWETADGKYRLEIYDPENLTIEQYKYDFGGWSYFDGTVADSIYADENENVYEIEIMGEEGLMTRYDFSVKKDMTELIYQGQTYYRLEPLDPNPPQ